MNDAASVGFPTATKWEDSSEQALSILEVTAISWLGSVSQNSEPFSQRKFLENSGITTFACIADNIYQTSILLFKVAQQVEF